MKKGKGKEKKKKGVSFCNAGNRRRQALIDSRLRPAQDPTVGVDFLMIFIPYKFNLIMEINMESYRFYVKALIDFYSQSSHIAQPKKIYESLETKVNLSEAESKICNYLRVKNEAISSAIINAEMKKKELVWLAKVSYNREETDVKKSFLKPCDRDGCAAFRKFGFNRFLKVILENFAESKSIGNEFIDNGLIFGGRLFKFLSDSTIDSNKASRKALKDSSYKFLNTTVKEAFGEKASSSETREAWFFAESDNDSLEFISVAMVTNSMRTQY